MVLRRKCQTTAGRDLLGAFARAGEFAIRGLRQGIRLIDRGHATSAGALTDRGFAVCN